MNCEIPWKSIESSACPPGVRPTFLPPTRWLNPVRGGLFIAPARPPPLLLFVFQRRGSGPPIELPASRQVGTEKQKEGWLIALLSINRSPLRGFWPLKLCLWSGGTNSGRCASISFSQLSSPKIWVMTSASARWRTGRRPQKPFPTVSQLKQYHAVLNRRFRQPGRVGRGERVQPARSRRSTFGFRCGLLCRV